MGLGLGFRSGSGYRVQGSDLGVRVGCTGLSMRVKPVPKPKPNPSPTNVPS